ncbi:MAG: putative DNA modification/repair radical SAM protein [Verrucomicrobiota bacterium]|nr:putative DNA modification/repair radical SAM protein [Verrucomicrobiota bacterium]
MELLQKLSILADAAKYDASCASSGTSSRSARESGGIGSAGGSGICHSYTPDGRCVSLLKILLTNFCTYDCLYCINRKSSNVPRARFTAEEVVNLTLDFYRRNYIEGLFLSSGIIRSPDYTMEQIIRVAKSLRVEHQFRGYIHLKTIPEAGSELIQEAGLYADRISINVELPTQENLDRLAPEKNLQRIEDAMGDIRTKVDESREKGKAAGPAFAPAGQSTQMIIGATEANDAAILGRASSLYSRFKLRRVYYSAYSPIPDASSTLPPIKPPLIREHRLYQADWLLRFYGFAVDEITPREEPNLDLQLDPKSSWALRHPEKFPVDLNKAPREMLLRVPGLGVRTVERLLQIRRWHRITFGDLVRLKVAVKKVMPFVCTSDHHPANLESRPQILRQQLAVPNEQLELFGT